jgi:signal peptidase I
MESYALGIFLSIWLTTFLLSRLGLYLLFQKAGQTAWVAFIPIVSWWFWIKLVGRPWWYMIGMMIPAANILFSFNITLDLLRSYGQFKFWQHLLGMLFTYLYLPWIGFKKEVKFLGQGGNPDWRKKNIPPHGGSREWADALLYAGYIAGGIRALYFDLYVIPTPSMESNMKVGDYLVVSRVKIGMRIPMTPLTVPVIAHKELMGMKAFSDLVRLPYMRLPGWHTIKNNDVLVFNWPADPPDPNTGNEFPPDKKENYVKRCVGVPGDSLKVVKGQVFIRKKGENWKALTPVSKQQSKYLLTMKSPITQDFLFENDLGDFRPHPRAMEIMKAAQKSGVPQIPYLVHTYKSNAALINKDPRVVSIIEEPFDNERDQSLFPDTANNTSLKHSWDINNYGPIYLPQRGETIKLDIKTWDYYKLAVNKYEEAGITWNGSNFIQDGKPVSDYTFRFGYFWMMGDNRYNSLDSRMWGYVPEDHIVGKPLFTFFSLIKVIKIDEVGTPLIHDGNYMYETKGVRWNKIFRGIE